MNDRVLAGGKAADGRSAVRRWLSLNLLLVFVPVAVGLDLVRVSPILVFGVALLALIPLAVLLSKATEHLSVRTNPTIGSLFNATTGNIIEILIALFAIRAGLLAVVKASITGSILVNVLLLIGLSVFIGGFRYKEQEFNRKAVGIASSMLLVAITGMAIPTVFGLTSRQPAESLSLAISLALGVIYVLSLVFTVFTHKGVFVVDRVADDETHPWSVPKAFGVLVLGTVAAAVLSEVLVGVIEPVSQRLGLTQAFIGLVVIAIVTNIAEKIAAVTYALKGKIDLSLNIGMNSATQVALFAVPILVLLGFLLGQPLNLVFSPYEMVAMVVSVIILNHIAADGDCNWLEGAELLTVYLLVITTFYFLK
ncbi:MAG: calcium/proton exchanger [Chloroflexi bacterium]|nr:calcium/proton exchanger [Chloroflexota bacterium]